MRSYPTGQGTGYPTKRPNGVNRNNIYHDVVLRTNVEKIDSGDRTGGWG